MPRSKKDTLRIIDTKPEVTGGGTLQTQALTIAPPPIGEVAAPSNLAAVASGVARSPVKPEAYVNVTWRSPLGTVPTYYDIEYGRSSEWNSTTKTFSNPQRVQSYNLGVTLSLGLNTAYRIRVRSVYRNATSAWTDTVQVTTADDTTPASPVTNVATNWNPVTGDLTITWTNPTDPQFRDARVKIYSDAGKLTLYRTVFSNSGIYVYTYAQNIQDSTSGDTSLVITIDTRNWASSGTVYSTGVDVTATLSNPGNVTVTNVTANSATGEAVWKWNAVQGATGYRITINSASTVIRNVFTNEYRYSLAQNIIDNGGSTPLTSIPYSIVAVDALNQVSATAVTGTATFTVPANVEGVTTTLNTITGEAVWRWTALSNVTGYRLTIDGTARDVFTNEYRYSLAQNRAEHSGSIDTSLAWNLVAYNAVNQVSATATTGTASFTAPSTPTGLTVNFDNPDCVFSWTLGTDVTGYRLSIDGVVRDLGLVNRFTYTLGQNESEHTVAPTPDHTLTYILTAYNALEQTTSTTQANITSPAPNAPTAVTLTAFFNVLAAVITGHTRLPTHYRYKFEFRKDGATHKTIYSTENTASLEINQTGSYIVRVSAEDVFGRSSVPLDSSAVVPDVLTLEELREDAIYSDSVGTAPATLDALKDNNTTSGGVTYAAGTAWKWTRFERPILDRYRTVTAGLFTQTAGTQIYFSTSSDNSTWQWWTGPLSSNRLISVGTEAFAQSGAITIGTTYATTTRWDLASIVEARYIRIHHRNASNTYVMYEFYPRRLIQSDDIEAESILAINIAAGTITGNNIAGNTITGNKIAADTITTRSLLVSGGTGMSITDDPNTIDVEAWSGGVIVTDSTSPSGKALQVTSNNGLEIFSTTYFPIDNAKNYIARIWGRQVSGTRTNYLTIAFYDSSFANVSGSATGWPGLGVYCYFGVIDQVLPSTWTEYTISFGPNETAKIPATARYVRIGTLAHLSGTGTTVTNYTRLIIAEKTTGSLIVDGTITATKIAANTITTSQLSATAIDGMTITGSNIRTGASGARVVLDSTGLTTYNSSNVIQIQASTGNEGQLWAGGGAIRLSSAGMLIKSTATSTENNIRWYADVPAIPGSNGDTIAGINGFWTTGSALAIVQDVYSTKTATLDTVRTRLSTYNESSVLQGRIDLADSFIQLTTSTVQRAQIDSNGFGIGLAPTARNNTTLQLANGIGFPATQVSSSDANTLDDYEEGTWSPTYTTHVGALPSVTYGVIRVGRYVKIGSHVTAWFGIETNVITAGALSNYVMIGGLPFATANITNFYCSGSIGVAATFGVNFPSATVANLNDTRAYLYYRDSPDGAQSVLQVSDLLTSSPGNLLYGVISYLSAA